MTSWRITIFSFILALLAAGLASCDDDNVDQEEKNLVISSWWTSGGEQAALNALVKVFKDKNPEVTVQMYSMTGGAGTGDIRKKMYEDLKNGSPPDTYQIHVGREFVEDVQYLTDINAIYEKNQWEKVFSKTLLESLKSKDKYYIVPLNIHRSNMLWYRKDALKAIGREDKPPTTWEDFFVVAEELKKKDWQVFAFNPAVSKDSKASWTGGHIFESILLAHLKDKGFLGLFDNTTSWNSEEVKKAFETFTELLKFKKEEAQDGPGYLVSNMTTKEKPAALAMMGDWFEGDLKAEKWTPGKEFGWAAAPQTADFFLYLADSFTLPLKSAHVESAKLWLEAVGSPEGQEAFNLLKGSIPARNDPNKAKYDDYLKTAIDDFSSKKLVPSLAHGAVGTPAFRGEYFRLIGEFIAGDRDSEKTIAELIAACNKSGMSCK
jgi:glucose/mannose transport system substrate-binding protein